MLGHLRCGDIHSRPAAASGSGIATVYRYIREAVDVLAGPVLTLEQAVSTAARKAYLILDGIRVPLRR